MQPGQIAARIETTQAQVETPDTGLKVQESRFKCRLPAHVRPAQGGDLEAIAGLYHNEVEDGWCTGDLDRTAVEGLARRSSALSNTPLTVRCRNYWLPESEGAQLRADSPSDGIRAP